MKKPLVGLTLGLFALLFMLSSAVWAVSANEHYQVGEDVQSNQAQITQGNLLSFNKDNKQTLYTPLNGGATDGQWLDFVEAWQLAADQGGAVTLQQDVLVTAADAPEGIFAQVPEDGQILLNLNGHRLVGEEVPCLIYVGARGKLTVTDGGQSGSQIVGVVYPDDSADDEDEWGQIELLGDVDLPAARCQQARVMALADEVVEAKYYKSNNTSDNPDYSGSFVEAWNKAATSSGTVKLLTNVNVAQCRFDTGYLLVPENKNITLDLNGCDIERGIVGQPKADGYVIRVAQNGTLTVKDQNDKGINDSGSIINGHNEGDGGCIYVESLGKLYLQSGELGSNNATGNGGAVYLETHAYFEMTGGYINLNDAYGSGGAIYMANNANFNMEGGIITQNKVNTVGESGGAVYANNSLAISVSGSAKIYENVSKKDGLNNKYDNVYLKNGLTINVSTALNDDAVIGITTETKPTDGNPVVVVEGTNLVASKFVSDDEQYETVLENSKIVLKAVAYQAEYTKDGTTKKGTFEAMWNLAAEAGGTVKLLDNVTAVGGSFGSGIGFECNKTSTSSTLLKGLIFVPDDKNITLDLNGKTINRGLTSMVDGGEVIRVDGTLTIDDSSGNNSGVITGGYGNDFGGIHVYGIKSPASLTMNGGTIRDNKSSRYGSGVLLAGNTTFNMNGGSIENNTVVSSTEQDGGGVYIVGGAQFNLSGKVNIINNTIQIGAENKQKNVFLAQGYNSTIINVVNSLDTTSKIGITLEEKPTDDTPKNIVSGKSSLSLSNFVSDDTNYYLTIKSNVYNNKTISLNKMPAVNHGWHSLDAGNNYASKSEDVPFVTELNLAFLKTCQIMLPSSVEIGDEHVYSLPAGNYYLNSNLNVDHPIYISGGTVNICLNGKNLTSQDGKIAIYNTGELHICDCTGNGQITGVSNPDGAIRTDGSFSLHNGKITENRTRGVFVHNGPVNIYDGEISNNTITGGDGAGIYMYAGSPLTSLNMYGGKICNNTIKYANNVVKGAGVYIYSTAGQFNMSGGEISGNKITGTNIDGNTTFNGEGGGVYTETAFNMSGGSIINNKAERGGGVYFNPGNAANFMTISGNIQIKDNKGFEELSNSEYNSNVNLAVTPQTLAKFIVGAPLGDSAEVHFEYGWGSATAVVAEPAAGVTLTNADAAKFVHEVRAGSQSRETVLVDGKIVLEGPHEHKLNVGLTGVTAGNDIVTFDKKLTLNESNQLCSAGTVLTAESVSVEYSTTDTQSIECYVLPAGSYYLGEDITIDKPIAIKAETVNLCLNNHKITLNSSDNVGAVIKLLYDSTSEGLTFNLTDCGTNGTITGGNAGTTRIKAGGGVYAYGGQNAYKLNFNMYGGNISGNESMNESANTQYARSGAGVFGDYYNGGQYIQSSIFNMYGGKISENKALYDGAGIYNGGYCHIYGGEITQNIASRNGGGIAVVTEGKLQLDGGKISNNEANAGGGIYNESGATSSLVMNGGEISGNTANGERAGGGGIFSKAPYSFRMEGGKINGNKATGLYGAGGGVCVKDNGNFTIKNGEISDNSATGDGGGVYISMSRTFSVNLDGGEISRNTAGANAGGIYVGATKANISNIKIIDNIAKGNGGGFYSGLNANSQSATSATAAILSGNPQIYGNKAYGNKSDVEPKANNIYLRKIFNNINGEQKEYYQHLSVGTNISLDAKIGLTAQQPINYNNEYYDFKLSGVGRDEYEQYVGVFFADNPESAHIEFRSDDKYIYYCEGEGQGRHVHAGSSAVYQPVSVDDFASASIGNAENPSYLYLTENVNLDKTIQIVGDVDLCLNGNSVVSPTDGSPAFSVGAGSTLKIYAESDKKVKELLENVTIKLEKDSNLEIINNASHDDVDAETKTVEASTDGTFDITDDEFVADGGDVTDKHMHNGHEYNPISTISNPLGAGYYYLTQDITLSQTITVTSGAAYICLNGKKITGPANGPAFKVENGATLNLSNDEGKAENNTDGFKVLAGSGGIEVAGGGTLNMIAQDPAKSETYAPAVGSEGGKVTVDNSGAVDKPDEGPHSVRHPELADATPLTATEIQKYISKDKPANYQGVLPNITEPYAYLTAGKYYMEQDFKLQNALIVLADTTYCLNGMSFMAENDE